MVSAKEKLSLANDISNIIPLDPETCNQMVEYAMTLPDNEVSDHFLNLLGESDATAAFLSRFMDIRASSKKAPQKTKNIPISNPAPVGPRKKASGNVWEAGKGSASPSPGPSSDKPAKKPGAKVVSDLMPNKSKDTKKDNRKARKKQTDNLKDLESILSALEVSEARDSRARCSCNATRHPLFEIAPNCLNCGKIICAREGLQPCSFCGHELLSSKDRQEIRDILSKEKDELSGNKKVSSPTPEPVKPQKQKKIVVSMRHGENFWKAQENALKLADEEKKLQKQNQEEEDRRKEMEEKQAAELEYYQNAKDVDEDLLAAQERLDTLLSFQDNGVERTKIIDNAADYELATSNSGNMWLSATERALKLKKQQRQLRRYEEGEQRRVGRGKRFVEMVIKDGKATMVERFSNEDEEGAEEEDIKAIEDELAESKKKTEESMAQNIWDYEADKNKWEKPVYSGGSKTAEYELPALSKRVQFDTKADPNELVVQSY